MVNAATVAALAATVPTALAAHIGFNTGSTNVDGSIKAQSDFEAEYNAAKKLAGTDGAFTASRLYTMIQGGTSNQVISAIPAALNTNTDLLLGLWASGTDNIDNELSALKTAIQQFPGLAQKCIGISVGSEDLYRNSPTGIANKAGVGQQPAILANFINQVKSTIQGTALSGCPVGHVDTWTAWQNATANQAVLDAVDFAGTDGYPYFQTQSGDNSIQRAPELFFDSVNVVKNAVGSKPVWVTETGWPWQGPTVGTAVASKDNAKTYWDNVYCKLKSMDVNTFWYTLVDGNSADAATFGVLGSNLNAQPEYDLSCSNVASSSSSASSPSSTGATSPDATRAAASATGGAGMPGGAQYTNIATSGLSTAAASTVTAVPYAGTGNGASGSSNSTVSGVSSGAGASSPANGASGPAATPGAGSSSSPSSGSSGSSSGSSSSSPSSGSSGSSGSSSGSSSSGTSSSGSTGAGSGTGAGAAGATPSTFRGAASSVNVKGSVFGLVAAAAAVLFL